MAQKKTLNQRRLTKRQVRELISSSARLRPDLTAALASTGQGLRVYELAGDRYLLMFGDQFPGLAGKGDIYAADDFLRFARWTAKVDEDDPSLANAGNGKRWERKFGLFDTRIV